MKPHKLTLAIMALACILLGTFSVASAELPAPSHFFGQVKINNANVPDGTQVSAWINGVKYAAVGTSTVEGHSVYALDVPGDDPATLDVIEGGQDGDTIVFKIGDLELEAEQTGTWTSGANVNLDLSVMVVTVTADPQSKVYGEVDPELTYTYDPQDPEIVFEGALDREPGEHVGVYAITPGDLAAAGYTMVFVPDDLIITPKPITITAEPKSKIYGIIDPPLTFTTSTPLVPGDSWDGGLARISGENVGQYIILRGNLGIDDDNLGANYAITYQQALLTIEPRPITVTADDQEKVFGELDPTLTYHISSGSLVAPDTIIGALARVGGEAVGTYDILIGSLAIDDNHSGQNYGLTFQSGLLTITPIPIVSVVVSDIQEPMAGASPDPLATIAADPTAGITALTADVTWDPLDDPFEPGTSYSASVTLTAAEGYTFSGSTTATVNGRAANASLNANGTLTVSYPFTTVLDPPCLEVNPTSLMKTQQADMTSQLILTLTNTCEVEVSFNLMESMIETPILNEGFEDGLMPPVGWEILQLNEAHTWEIVMNPIDQGQYAASVRFDASNSSDEWLISPVLDVSAIVNLALSFRAYTDTNFPGASMKVWVLDADGQPLTDQPLWDLVRDEDWPVAIYRSVLVDLGQFDSYGEIRIGWQYVGQDGQNFYLDTIYAGSRSEMPWLELSLTSGSIAAGENKEIAVTFNSTELDLGTSQGLLSLINYPHPMINIPVRLRVIGEGLNYYIPLVNK